MSVNSAKSETSQLPARARANSVCVLLPGLLHSEAGDGVELPAICRLLSRTVDGCPDVRTFEQVVLEWFNVQTTRDTTCAAALGVRIEGFDNQRVCAPGESLFRADPIYQQIDLHHILLGDPDLLKVSTEEAQALIASLNSHLSGDRIRLLATHAQRWYLLAPDHWQLHTSNLSAAVGHNIAHYGVQGADAGKWRQLLTECQMILFDHPVNRQREQRGQLPINSLWLWGEGSLPTQASSDAIARRVVGDDFYTASLADFKAATLAASIDDCHFAGEATLVVDRRLQIAVNTGDQSLRDRVLMEIEQTIFQPIWQNLSSSRARRVNLWTGECWLQLSCTARRQFWRRRRSFGTFIESNHAQ